MKIISLQAENIKKLVAVEIIPKTNTVILTGANGEGKTSVLDCISWAFEGKAKIQKSPIRYGENKAWIEIETEKYTVRRDFKFKKVPIKPGLTADSVETDSTLTVTSKDGAEFSSPQALLDTVFGELAFDPLAFSRASAKDQVAALEGLVKDFDFAKSRVEEELAYNERTVVNRKAKDASQTHISFKDVPVPEPEKVDVKALTDKLASVADRNVETERLRTARNYRESQLTTGRLVNDQEFSRAEESFKSAEQVFAEAKKAFELAESKLADASRTHEKNKQTYNLEEKEFLLLPALPELEDVATIKAELESAQAKNALHETWTKKNAAKLEIEKREAESKALTEKIEEIQKTRREAVAKAQIPVEGLGFDTNGVTLNGIPFEQCSSGEKLKTSVILAMLSNPDLRVIRVADGSLLDEKGMEMLSQLAKEKDYQIFVEKTDTSGKIGIVIEEGKVLRVNE